ncbi:MAG: DUF721 domain-containing protein [Rickettsiales bacterium]|nr:DUF721 domain-containing protein [Rickettsiales bacterium]
MKISGPRKSYGMQTVEQKLSNLLSSNKFTGNKKEFIIINNLIKNWEEIIGKKYAPFCYPKSITSDKSEKNLKLTIAAHNSSIGFQLESNSEFLLEKITKLYGYKVISKIIIKQEPKQVKSNSEIEIKLSKEEQEKIDSQLKNVENQELAEVLSLLGKDIYQEVK